MGALENLGKSKIRQSSQEASIAHHFKHGVLDRIDAWHLGQLAGKHGQQQLPPANYQKSPKEFENLDPVGEGTLHVL